MRVTVREVASLAVVSVCTASYALNDPAEVSSATRQSRVEHAPFLEVLGGRGCSTSSPT
jgi:hypothetical protein